MDTSSVIVLTYLDMYVVSPFIILVILFSFGVATQLSCLTSNKWPICPLLVLESIAPGMGLEKLLGDNEPHECYLITIMTNVPDQSLRICADRGGTFCDVHAYVGLCEHST